MNAPPVTLAVAGRAIESVHERFVRGRRVRRLLALLAPLLAEGGDVLDVGSGDGQLTAALAAANGRLSITGVDVLVRPDAAIPTVAFDGRTLPFADKSFDAVLFVDVLHHTTEPTRLLRQASRVARKRVIVKDHVRDGWLAQSRLAFMDRVGNRRHGVALPCAYLDRAEWDDAFAAADLTVDAETRRLGLYPPPFGIVFDGSLQVLFAASPGRA